MIFLGLVCEPVFPEQLLVAYLTINTKFPYLALVFWDTIYVSLALTRFVSLPLLFSFCQWRPTWTCLYLSLLCVFWSIPSICVFLNSLDSISVPPVFLSKDTLSCLPSVSSLLLLGLFLVVPFSPPFSLQFLPSWLTSSHMVLHASSSLSSPCSDSYHTSPPIVDSLCLCVSLFKDLYHLQPSLSTLPISLDFPGDTPY